MKLEYLMIVEVGYSFGSDFGGGRETVDHFGIVVDKCNYGIVSVLCHGKLSNQVNTNVFPGATWNREGLK
jgi:hypothetical protein